MKRILSIFLCVCLLFTLLPFHLVAAEMSEDEIAALFEDMQDAEDSEEFDHPGVETDSSDTLFYEEGELDEPEDLFEDFMGAGDEHGVIDEPDDDDEDEKDDDPDELDEEYEVEILVDFTEENLEQLAHEYVMDEIIIKFIDESEVPARELRRYHRERARFEKVNYVEGLDVYVIKVSEMRRDPNAVLNRYKNNKYIEYAEPNYVAKLEAIPNDPQYNSQQSAAMARINAPAGWSILKGNPNAPIAIIDSGMLANHQDLPRFVGNYSAVAGLSANNDSARHGTAVAGVAGAIGDNRIGGAGVNWNASIMNVKVDNNGSLSVANVAKGIIWAVDNGAKVINLSLVFSSDNTTLKNAVDYAYRQGVVIVAASGNNGTVTLPFPARYSNVLTVGATIDGSTRVSWSNHGTGLDVVANGAMMAPSAAGENSYVNSNGTSFAAPQVAGLASLVLGINPNLTNIQVYDLIRQGARRLGGGINTQTGHGIIDIGRTLELARATLPAGQQPATTAPPTTAAPTTAPPTTAAPTTVPATTAAPTTAAPTTAPAIALSDGASSFVTSVPAGTRNNYTGSLGYEFEALADMTVSSVGRPLNGAMNGSHRINIWEVSTQRLIAHGTVTPASPLENGFKVAPLNTTITLKAGERYRIVSAETAGGDLWYNIDQSGTLQVTGAARIITSVNTGSVNSYPNTLRNAGENKGFVGVTFFYTLDDSATPATQTTALANNIPPVITLLGPTEVKINVGESFVEMGYKAEDSNGRNITNRVMVSSTINASQAGLYTITYDVTDDHGNSARSTRLVFVEELPRVPPTAPIITLVGSTIIKLHETSGTPYTEQMAKATDFDGTDISDKVIVSWDKPLVQRTAEEIIRAANGDILIVYSVGTYRAGIHRVTYSVTGSTGLTSTVIREVRILTPNESAIRRVEYGFNGKGKQGDTVRHTNVIAKASGFLDLDITALGASATITVNVIDSANKVVVSDKFSALGARQYQVPAGTYEVRVTMTQASGNKDYKLTVRMPVAPDDIKTFYYEDEIPLPIWGCPECFEEDELCEKCAERDPDMPDPDLPRLGLPSWFSPLTEDLTATPSVESLTVNGKLVTLNAYLIREEPFFKLRDFAYMLMGTANEFSVEWRAEDSAIILTTGEAYVPVGGEMEGKGSGTKVPRFTESKIFLDGAEVMTAAYLIDGNNYFILSELARIFGLEIDWNPEAHAKPAAVNAVVPASLSDRLTRRLKKMPPKTI